MKLLYLLLALIAGGSATLQAGVNGALRTSIGNPILASLISFLVGSTGIAIAFILVVLTGNQTFPSLEYFKQVQWWMWTGGLLGAFFVFVTIIAPPKIGYANLFCLAIAGQIILAILFDHFGAFGNTVNVFNLYKAIGVLLLIAGVYIIQTN